ncbi:benzoate 4-monooxygenase cytochrome P450 [Eremomyces bilateralis CBS 781.70]|uniref:Benzoate 4-monooxygenase cytochrome P450 n=1 Tax=Eremomyces bilateralis CBS 781.70 TaxID=1392243 RepID=A0A6G1FY51_9PEZI|nr:benzoate 4-monooxygenase cytochrome P450 [Eremomyces bilateralis CBS 781.70]KAF1810767.1 benzoate 4-monooxygenase cytochrome P450 [Eremomyces bilateralis CBS 781.70]
MRGLNDIYQLGDPSRIVRILSAIALLAILYPFALAVYNLYLHPLRKVPGPKLAAATKLPKIWHLARGGTLHWITQVHHEYGPIVRVGPNELSFIDAQGWKDIYGFQPAGKAGNAKDPKFYDFASVDETNLVNANDQDHARTRRIFSNAFSDKALKEQEPLLMKYVDLMVQKLHEKVEAEPDEKVNMVEILNFTTFDIMGDLTFGEPLYMLQNSKYTPWVTTIFNSLKATTMLQAISFLPVVSSLVNLLLGRFIIHARNVHFRYSTDRVDRRLVTQTDRPDIWTLVLRQVGEKALSLGEMHANADLFMIAGTETTATLLSGLLYYLLMNPEKMKKLKDEIRSAFQSQQDIRMGGLVRLKYLHACIEEGLRMYPPAPTGLPRLTPPGGTAICGEWVPGNTTVYVTPFTAFRSATNFRNPGDFIPERWISSDYDSDNKSVLQPFSVGPRNCIGKNLAYHEIRLLLATTLYHFDMTLCDESMNWCDQKVFALWEKPPLMVNLALAGR